MLKKTHKQKGVSLVELLVVMAILSILAAIAIVSYTMFIRRAKTSKAEQELIQVYNLIYMMASENTIQIGQNEHLETALYVTTSGNKIVLMYNDKPTEMYSSGEWDYENILHWEHEDYWNVLLRELIDEVTGDIGMFSGLFELNPTEKTAIISEVHGQVEVVENRNITYILENNEELRSKKELIVTTINDVETITKYLSDLEAQAGKLVPTDRVVDASTETEMIEYEVWYVWTAGAGYVLGERLTGNIELDYEVLIESSTLNAEELAAAYKLINGLDDEGNVIPVERLFTIEIVNHTGTTMTDFPDVITIRLSFNREPKNKYEYDLIQNNIVKLQLTLKIRNIELVEGTPTP
jgi:prepilin-type N-terminal cleavage/methylation domain-containing protein